MPDNEGTGYTEPVPGGVEMMAEEPDVELRLWLAVTEDSLAVGIFEEPLKVLLTLGAVERPAVLVPEVSFKDDPGLVTDDPPVLGVR